MSNDAARDRVTDVLARLQDQLTDIAALQKKQAALRLNAQAADGTVEVTVDARGQLVKAVIDKSYLDDHDFEDLGDHITEAARAAAEDASRRVAEMLAPINERHKEFPSFSDIVENIPDPKDLVPPGLDAFVEAPRRQEPAAPSGVGYDDRGDADFPTVRR
ncbi:YbaB/EbfC family nucleoid-associated protein [Mycobacterium heidelbergense]|uniref:YbaB/EbfC family nucleoid-associated protein n=1 Tax=Mycobacterium heidelbergense TaxID=53376 RepID=UPI003CF2510B